VATTQRAKAEDSPPPQVRPGQQERAGARARIALAAALALVLIAVALVWRLATEHVPPLSIKRTLASYVRVPGVAPTLAWPREGQAAVEVEGVGSFGALRSSAPVPIASVAKMMTAYLTLREHPLSEGQPGFQLTVTPADVREYKQRLALAQSTVPVRVGERISERQALQALLLPSANNIAALLAAHSPGGMAAFIAQMNATAHDLGMRSTTYTDPSGFDPTTVSTAADQLELARAAMRLPAFAAIVDQPSVDLPVAGVVENYDALLGEDGYVGVKTGSDSAAGGCFVFAKHIAVGARRLTVLGVVLGQREGSLVPAALASARRLGDSAAAAVRVVTALPAGAGVLTAASADGRRATIVTARALQEVGWAGLVAPVEVSIAHSTATTLAAGQRLAAVTLQGARASSAPAVASRTLGQPSLGWRLTHLL
jgi:serine-type D-Ala-D-Ala carboxypeptidase (penicillin-binding protein 5/6)